MPPQPAGEQLPTCRIQELDAHRQSGRAVTWLATSTVSLQATMFGGATALNYVLNGDFERQGRRSSTTALTHTAGRIARRSGRLPAGARLANFAHHAARAAWHMPRQRWPIGLSSFAQHSLVRTAAPIWKRCTALTSQWCTALPGPRLATLDMPRWHERIRLRLESG